MMLRDVNIAIATKIIHHIVRPYFGFIKKYNYAHKACWGGGGRQFAKISDTNLKVINRS